MIKLICDTSTSKLILLLIKEDIIIDSYIKENGIEHSKYLTFEIKSFLEKNKLSIKEIDEFVVGYGPGSYTGLRIGVMEFKTFAYALKKKLFYISSLVLLSSKNTLTISYVDARRGNYFVELYNEKDILLSKVLTFEEINELENKYNIKGIDVLNSNIEFDYNVIKNHIHEVIDINHFIPNYLRQTEAEENRDKKIK
jgi:tRNA threonylcarbamoyladenosine biosynthesis protein TsaB